MNTAPLLPIGAFSNATQLSAKALRLYAEQGILAPARIDAETGYRYYRPEQVRDARIVRLLRELDLPLSQIAAMLAQPASTTMAVKMQMDALAARYTRQQNACQALLTLLGSSAPHVKAPQERELPAATMLTFSFEAHAGNLLARARTLLSHLAADTGLATAADAVFIALPAAAGEQEETMLDLCIPLPQGRNAGVGDTLRTWPALHAVAAEVGVQDGVPDLVTASDALFDWFDRRGHSLRDTPRLYLHAHAPQLVWPIS